MSELKEYKFCECDEFVREYRGQLSNEMHPYYLKSEADKVIADLEESHKKEVEQLLMEIVELKADYKEACDRLQTANLIKDEQLAATRHQKYKRCLNKAEWCEERSARYDLLQERTGFDWSREIGFYFKWQQRWLELAEKFKPNMGQIK